MEALSLVALKAALQSLGSWLFANVIDPRFWAVLAIAVGIGFIKGCQHEDTKHEELEKARAIVAQAQHDKALEINANNRKAREGAENAAKNDRKELVARNADLSVQLRRISRGGGLRNPSPSAGFFLQGTGLVCADAAQLDAALRGVVLRAATGFSERAQRVLEGHGDRLAGHAAETDEAGAEAFEWGGWARAVGACPALAPPAPPRFTPQVGPHR